MIYFCCNQQRRMLVSAHPTLNGIDRVEVVDGEYDRPGFRHLRQKELRVFFIKPPDAVNQAAVLTANRLSVRLTGGESVTGIAVENASWQAADGYLRVRLSAYGDHSVYTLHLVEKSTGPNPPFDPMPGLDPRLSLVDFHFKIECPSEFDCADVCDCAPAASETPELDYLAKDYASFRRLMLDRMSLIAPDWKERNAADLGIMLVELLAYAGDHLSYQQDAVATEAYQGTARQRISLRRHVRLLDYAMHEGCAARAWVRVCLKETAPAAGVLLPRNGVLTEQSAGLAAATCFAVRPAEGPILATTATELNAVIAAEQPVIFEPVHEVVLHYAHNEMPFHTWGDSKCCLPAGAVKATLLGAYPSLAPGMVLVLAEVLGPRTGHAEDADPARRHAVRLSAVNGVSLEDWLQGKTPGTRTDPVTGAACTDIEWDPADALPFPLCLSSVNEDGNPVSAVSVAWGNVVLCDHGVSLPERENLGSVPTASPALMPVAAGCGHCEEPASPGAAVRFRPRLNHAGLTHAVPVPPSPHPWLPPDLPASQALWHDTDESIRAAVPAIRLRDGSHLWSPQRDLISSAATTPDFVVEVDNAGRAVLRFGDDVNGMAPAEGATLHARMRLGNGTAGNIGADSISQLYAPAFYDPAGWLDEGTRTPLLLNAADVIRAVSNPLPARGGTPAETMEEVRQYAPQAYRTQRRCVTPQDYADRAGQHPLVQRAAATLRWTGSWHTIFLTVDRRDGLPVDAAFETAIRDYLEPWRMAGHDLEIDAPSFVSLEITLTVCVRPGYFRSDVKRALLTAFSSRRLADGTPGFFHPDNFTFGDSVYLSAVLAAAQSVTGVRHVEAAVFRRQGETTTAVPAELTTARLEIPRLENNPAFADHGIIGFTMKGGR
jgi:hypothetical protein